MQKKSFLLNIAADAQIIEINLLVVYLYSAPSLNMNAVVLFSFGENTQYDEQPTDKTLCFIKDADNPNAIFLEFQIKGMIKKTLPSNRGLNKPSWYNKNKDTYLSSFRQTQL